MSERMTLEKLAGMTMRGLEEVKDVLRDEFRNEIGKLEHKFDQKLDQKIDALDQKMDYRFNALSNRLDDHALNKTTREEHRTLERRVTNVEKVVFGTV